MASKIYLIDTGVLVQAKRSYYAFDFCPGFWDMIIYSHTVALIESIDKVKDEINNGYKGDELLDWVKANIKSAFFNSTNNPQTAAVYKDIINWAAGQKYTPAALAYFAKGADGWLIAHALLHNKIVVTMEKPDSASKRNIKIPNVCNAFGVQWMDTFDMTRGLGHKLILRR